MANWVDGFADGLLSVDRDLAGELDALLVEASPLAFRVAYSVLRQREDAEDVAQDALVRACRQAHQLRDRDRFRAWLVRMTWRLAIDRQRSDRRRAAREAAHGKDTPTATVADVTEAGRQSSELWAALDALPEKLRITMVLAGIEGHDLAAVGRLLGVPEGTVKSRMFLARRRLRERLQW
jgi:RNA polymerase sigma-70 factor (ECF subfamily)